MPLSQFAADRLNRELFNLTTTNGEVWIGPHPVRDTPPGPTKRYRADAVISDDRITARILDPGPYEWDALPAGWYAFAAFPSEDAVEPGIMSDVEYRIFPGDTLHLADRETSWGVQF